MPTSNAKISPLFLHRRAGILLHPSSLPNELSFSHDQDSLGKPIAQLHGNLGKDAYKFVDFLANAGISLWQMLPIGPTHADLSPYQSVSSHAGNPELISIDWLLHNEWAQLDESWEPLLSSVDQLPKVRAKCANQFYRLIDTEQGTYLRERLNEFCLANQYWLDDFVLFMALRKYFDGLSWHEWPVALKKRESAAMAEYRDILSNDIALYVFEQFAFSQQWQALRNYAKEHHVFLFGDIPIFVAHDSADVWAAQEFFNLDEEGVPRTVAGVPPDYFSETGQHWGNPHYNWAAMEASGFSWWLDRLRTQLRHFDLIRIDHFRGFEAFWEIPGGSKDAREGRWVKAPGEAFLAACFDAFHDLPLVAENLGLITQEVESLRHQFHLPGMLVLQFAFDGNNKNPHLPHRHSLSDVIYTGTHDNDTTLGWYKSLSEEQQKNLRKYLYASDEPMPWLLIDSALASIAPLAIIPMQDVLELDGEHRMNMPGTTGANWRWQFTWEQLAPNLSENLHRRLDLYDRLN